MANETVPFGLLPILKRDGSFVGALNAYHVPATDSTAIGMGDLVKLAGSSKPDGTLATITKAATANAVIGVVMGFAGHPDTVNLRLRPASVAMDLLVLDDPNAEFLIKEDSVGGALTAGSTGQNVNVATGTPNTATGRSGSFIDSSTAGVGATLQLKLLGIDNTPQNALGDNANWRVKINNHQLGTGTGTAGA